MRYRDWKHEFNFYKIQSIMEELNWSYFDGDCPPSKDRLRETIEGLIDHLEEDEDASVISSGGFRITDKDEEDAYLIEFITDTSWIEKPEGES